MERADMATNNREAVSNASVITSNDSSAAVASGAIVPLSQTLLRAVAG
jgi:hypothetical protein